MITYKEKGKEEERVEFPVPKEGMGYVSFLARFFFVALPSFSSAVR